MSDLHTLLRDHVERTEPVRGPDPFPSIAGGRRRLRSQRVALAASVMIAVTAGAVAVPRLVADDPGSGRGIDPVTQRALAEYDAQQMPRILEEHVSTVLERSVPDLPPARFYAGDDQGRELDPEDYDRASGMSLNYGDGTDHRWAVSLTHSRSEAEGDARENCANDVSYGFYLSCDVTVTDSGDVVMTRLTALRPVPMFGQSGPSWKVVNVKRLDETDTTTLWFSRDVKVVHSETFLTYASEIVKAPSLAAAERLFEVPVADLVKIGTDPELVIPEPSGV